MSASHHEGPMAPLLENQDLLIAILSRVGDPAQLCRLSTVSRSLRAAVNSDTVWASAIISMFGKPALARAQAWVTDGPIAQGDDLEGSTTQRTLRMAFQSMVHMTCTQFMFGPEDAITSLTDGLDTDQASLVGAKFIYWCAIKRAGLPDIRSHAIKFMTEPKGAAARELSKAVRKSFVTLFDLRGKPLGGATREFLGRITMPCEASRICRIMWDFAGQYRLQNTAEDGATLPLATPANELPDVVLRGLSQDEVYMLVWSMLVLNTDAHNPKVQQKMKADKWVSNTIEALNGSNRRPPAAADDADTAHAADAAAAAATAAVAPPPAPAPEAGAAGAVIGEGVLRRLFENVTRAPLLDMDELLASRTAHGNHRVAAAAAGRGGGWADGLWEAAGAAARRVGAGDWMLGRMRRMLPI